MLGSIANAKIETIVFMAINGITERLRFTIWAIACCLDLVCGCGMVTVVHLQSLQRIVSMLAKMTQHLPYAKTAGEKAMKAHMQNTLNDGTSIAVRITATTPTNIIQPVSKQRKNNFAKYQNFAMLLFQHLLVLRLVPKEEPLV